ncbi:MAG: contractile injection system protein, VgrG/Pvc8 family [Desulfobacterales bacterium]|nr:contractile injection system protein, VgrG/Pvc8 family [Desulfobacterales bacterium]
MTLTQENRLLSITTPLGEETLLLTGFSGSEGISQPFSFELTLASEDTDINPRDIIGQSVTVSIGLSGRRAEIHQRHRLPFLPGAPRRWVRPGAVPEHRHVLGHHGPLVLAAHQDRELQDIPGKDRAADRGADLRRQGVRRLRIPAVRRIRSKGILRPVPRVGFQLHLPALRGRKASSTSSSTRTARHVLVLADSSDAHQDCPHQVNVRCQLTGETTLETEDVIKNIGWGEEIRFGKYTTKDFNFLMPLTDLRVEMPTRITVGQGDRELYDFPGEYLHQ